MTHSANTVFSFGEFELDADRRLLLREGETVPLKAKAFDLLLAFVENRGEILSKNQLLDIVWENQFVEENNLTVHVAALRKALGEKKSEHRYIVTVPGKGYRFVGDLRKPTNGEMFVSEHRTFEKIVVDEEFEEQFIDDLEGEAAAAPATRAAVHQATSNGKWKAITALAVVGIAVLGIAVTYAFRSQIAHELFSAAVPFREHRVVQLTTNGNVGIATLSPNGKVFAYVVDDVGMKSLWLGNVDGGNHLELRPAAEATYYTLAFSPDGGQLYFSVRDEKNPTSALLRMPAFGGVSTKLKEGVSSFALSPKGDQIAAVRADGENHWIYVMAPDGSDGRDLAVFPKNQVYLRDSLSWSNDATKLAFSIDRPERMYRQELGVLEVASGTVTRIRLANYREITKTAWLADGSGMIITAIEEESHSSVPQYRLVHVSYPGGVANDITADRSNYGASWHSDSGPTLSLDGKGTAILAVEHRQLSNVWVGPADDLASMRQITFSSFGRYDGLWGMDWTPDGKIIYTTSDTRNQYLAVMNADGSDQKPLTDPVANPGHVDSVLTVSNDGRYILFHSNRVNGEFDIWRADSDGSNAKQLTFGGKNFIPAPSRDGKWVYYKSWLDGVGALRRVPMDGGEPERLTDKETTWVSFSPDGKYFAASYRTDKLRLAIFSSETHEVVRQFDLPKTGTLVMGSRWTGDSEAVTYRDNSFGYWIQPIDGGEPRRLEGMPRERLYNFSWSRDGKWLAFVRGQEIRDVVLFRRSDR